MVENHPAKIAKYLLKGWCLLNEYCPNGHNVPLVRSREGQVVCCGCEAEEAAREPLTATPGPAVAAAPVAAAPAEASPLPEPKAAWAAPGAGGASAVAARAAAAPAGATGPGGAAAGLDGLVEVAVQGPELQFRGSRLAADGGGRSRLLGDRWAVKARAAGPAAVAGGLAGFLKEALLAQCAALGDRVLVPEGTGTTSVNAADGLLTVVCEDGARFALPERDCVLLPAAAAGSGAAAAAAVAERILECLVSGAAGALGPGAAQWLEVSVAEGPCEVSVRKALAE